MVYLEKATSHEYTISIRPNYILRVMGPEILHFFKDCKLLLHNNIKFPPVNKYESIIDKKVVCPDNKFDSVRVMGSDNKFHRVRVMDPDNKFHRVRVMDPDNKFHIVRVMDPDTS